MTGTIDNVPVIFMLMQSMSELKYFVISILNTTILNIEIFLMKIYVQRKVGRRIRLYSTFNMFK